MTNNKITNTKKATFFKQHWPIFILIILAFAVSIIYFQTTAKWWFEDDPILYHTVSKITNPLAIFYNPDILRNFATGQLMVHMQILTYWLDVFLFGFNPLFAYIHNFISLCITLILLYKILFHLTKNNLISISFSFLWLLLPSTLVVQQYISTRHYLEGLLLALIAIYITQKLMNNEYKNAKIAIVFIILCSALAMVSKETYAASVPTFLALVSIEKQKRWPMITAIALVILFIIYRFWMVGLDTNYPEPLINNVTDYITFLKNLTFTLTATHSGKWLYLLIAILSLNFIVHYRLVAVKHSFYGFILILACLLAIYPASRAIIIAYSLPTTWYRLVFLINTILIAWTGYVIAKGKIPLTVQLAIIVIFAALILPGTTIAKQFWSQRMLEAELEGKFYLEYPNRLLYSQEDATWFIVGVHRMYDVPHQHFINKDYATNVGAAAHARKMLNTYSTIWQHQAGKFIQDDELYQNIQGQVSQ